MISCYPYAYCIEDLSKIENYKLAKADDFKGWCVHHRFELKCPVYKPTSKELIEWGLYYHRPASELIFLKTADHVSLHTKGKSAWNVGKHSSTSRTWKLTEEQRNAISERQKGKKLSEEHKKKISTAMRKHYGRL